MQVIAVYPGRFHPFHRGHAASFKQLVQKFGLDNTFLAISAKQEQPKSPFSAQDRAKMAMSLGIPSKNIIAVRNPYAAQEYMDQLNLDPEKTALVFGVSKKDMEGDPALGIPPDPRFSFKAKKDGSPSYLQPFNPKKVDPMSQHGYVLSTEVAEFPIAGKSMRDASAIRSAYAGADDNTKMKILKDLYGDAAESMKQVFDNNLQITESIKALIKAIKPMIGEATVQQKAKFVKLLSEAKKTMIAENTNRVYSARMAEIIEDLGDGYFLGDDSYDDDEGFTKAGYSVYKQVGDDAFKHIGHVPMSPYRNEPGTIERGIEQIIAQDKGLNEEDKSGVEQAYHDPDTHAILAYAQQHYPDEPDLQAAFVKFVLRSLKHSKDDDERQDVEIDYVQGRLRSLQKEIEDLAKQVSNKKEVTETQDYLDEK